MSEIKIHHHVVIPRLRSQGLHYELAKILAHGDSEKMTKIENADWQVDSYAVCCENAKHVFHEFDILKGANGYDIKNQTPMILKATACDPENIFKLGFKLIKNIKRLAPLLCCVCKCKIPKNSIKALKWKYKYYLHEYFWSKGGHDALREMLRF